MKRQVSKKINEKNQRKKEMKENIKPFEKSVTDKALYSRKLPQVR